MAPSKVVMLVANETNPTNLKNAEKLRTLFKSKKIVWEEIDGTDPTNKEKRSELFGISGLRAEYPQVFFQDSVSSQYRFIGNYGKISTLNENAELLLSHPEILEHNPDLADQVFDKIFAEVMPCREVNKDAQSAPAAARESPKHKTTEAKEAEAEEKTTVTEVKAKEKTAATEVEAEEKTAATEVKAIVEETKAEANAVDQKESPTTMSPTSVQTNLAEDQNKEKADKAEKEAKAEQIVDSKEVVLLEKDAAEDADENKENAEEDQKEEPSDKAQPLRKRDRVKGWFKRMTGSQRN